MAKNTKAAQFDHIIREVITEKNHGEYNENLSLALQFVAQGYREFDPKNTDGHRMSRAAIRVALDHIQVYINDTTNK